MTSVSIETLEDEELVAMANAGCRDSFDVLSDRFRNRLLVVLIRKLKHREDAEDIVQETLSRAYQKLSSFDPGFKFSTWIYTIALRLASDHARKKRRWFTWFDASTYVAEHVERGSRNQDASSDHPYEGRDQLWDVARRRLTEAQYTALWLRYAEGMSLAEVAEVMQKREGTIRVLLSRARDSLAKHMVSGMDSAPILNKPVRGKSS